jgi:hypothetical protein
MLELEGEAMIRITENARIRLMMIHGVAMLALGLALLYIRATMTNLFFYVFGGALAMMLVASSLLLIAGVDWICAAGLGCHQVSRLRGFLFVSTAVAVCCLLLILYPGATIQMLCYVIAAYALLLSIGKFTLARSWNGTVRQRSIMFLLAGAGLIFSGAMLAVAGKGDREALAVLGIYSVFMGLQMLLTMYFLQQSPSSTRPPSKLKQAGVATLP